MAFKSILNNKIRSLLTMLGIIIGVASVIAIVASIQGTTKLQKLQYEAMGDHAATSSRESRYSSNSCQSLLRAPQA